MALDQPGQSNDFSENVSAPSSSGDSGLAQFIQSMNSPPKSDAKPEGTAEKSMRSLDAAFASLTAGDMSKGSMFEKPPEVKEKPSEGGEKATKEAAPEAPKVATNETASDHLPKGEVGKDKDGEVAYLDFGPTALDGKTRLKQSAA